MKRLSDTVQQIVLKDFRELTSEELGHILQIRNEAKVRRNMYGDQVIGADEHRTWIHELSKAEDVRMFAVIFDEVILGAAGLTKIAWQHKRSDWAFYLSAAAQGKGLGSALEFRFLDIAFSEFALEKLNCEVLAFNSPVIAMHRKFGFVDEGVRRSHIERGGNRIDAVLLGITAIEWETRRAELRQGLFK